MLEEQVRASVTKLDRLLSADRHCRGRLTMAMISPRCFQMFTGTNEIMSLFSDSGHI